MDPRWKGRKFDWFFTSTDEDIKLSSLPRPSFLPPEFWEVFYEKGVFIALVQGVVLIGGLYLVFLYLPFLLNGILLAVVPKAP